MTKALTFLILTLCLKLINAQTGGLEKIIVEKYYISDANDMANTDGGVLPIGSTTYRIYVDMLPGYVFQAAYGVPGHELKISSSTTFFNNEDRGGITANYSKSQARNNTVMLDSWLSVGSACSSNYGVLKSEDDGIATVLNKDGILKNEDARAGIPLTIQDGLLDGSPEDVTLVGLTQASVFDDITIGGWFSTFDGSWASLNGSSGPDTTNKVLIAQMTTDGDFSFELNIQIRSNNFEVERYVARNPVGDEKTHEGLIYPLIISNDDFASDNAIYSVYPNPGREQFTIELSKNAIIGIENIPYSLTDVKGSTMIRGQINTSNDRTFYVVDMSKMEDGLYFISININSRLITKKILKTSK